MGQAGNGDIADTPARTYAEYVVSVPEPERNGSSMPLRPSLLFRIHSERLRVQAYAKSLRERLLSGPLVDFYIGKEKKHWALHRNLLLYHSDSIKAELSSSPESTPKSKQNRSEQPARLDIPDVEPAGFELLVKWLYQGKLEDASVILDPHDKYAHAVACYNLYLLCQRFDIPVLKNMAMDQYRKSLNQAELVPDAEEINELYRRSADGSPFRRLVIKIAARQVMDPDSDRDAENYRKCFEGDPSFAVDLVNMIKWSVGGVLLDDPTRGEGCEYHDHDSGPNCHSKGKSKLGPYFELATSSPATPTPQSRRAPAAGLSTIDSVLDNVADVQATTVERSVGRAVGSGVKLFHASNTIRACDSQIILQDADQLPDPNDVFQRAG